MRHFIPACMTAAVSCIAFLSTAYGQSSSRDAGWEFGTELIYQDARNIDFNGGSSVSLDDDLGIALTFGYRLSERLELQFGVDWQSVDFGAHVVSDTAGGLEFDARGDLESFTPRASFNFNFIDGAVTPYVSGGIGWTFIDTNIPDAPPQSVCWWDPWWGYMCGTFQSTRSVDAFTYQAGAGIRWDLAAGYSLRLGYEKRWIDLSEASSAPDIDQFKLGIVMRY